MTAPTAAEQEFADRLVLEYLVAEQLAHHITGWRAEREATSVGRLSVDFIVDPKIRATGAIGGLPSIVVAALHDAGLKVVRK